MFFLLRNDRDERRFQPIGLSKLLWRRLHAHWQRWRRRPGLGRVHFGALRRVTPVSPQFGIDRGLCIDRYYIEKFLTERAEDIKGQVLEIGDDRYARKFGGSRITKSDVLHVRQGNPKATIVADLSADAGIHSDSFDCIIFTQTLPFIYDFHAAVRSLYRILKPGGVLLATFPGISQISRYDMERWGDYWRFTTLSARRLLAEAFPPEAIDVRAHGNVLAAVAFLHGLAAKELEAEELDYFDPDYEVLIAARAVKPKANV